MKKSWALVAAVALSLALAGPASANKPTDPSKATKAIASLRAEAPVIRSVDPSVTQAAQGTRTMQALLAESCREGTWRVTAHNIFGWRIFSYVRWVRWCWSGSLLTSVSTRAWGEVFLPGWSFRGTIGSWTSGGPGRTSYRVWSQGHFCLVEYFSCIANSYPWIDVTVYPGGGWRWSWGGA